MKVYYEFLCTTQQTCFSEAHGSTNQVIGGNNKNIGTHIMFRMTLGRTLGRTLDRNSTCVLPRTYYSYIKFH